MTQTMRLSVYVTGMYDDLPNVDDARLSDVLRPVVAGVIGAFDRFEQLAEGVHFLQYDANDVPGLYVALGDVLKGCNAFWPGIHEAIALADRGTATDAWNREVERAAHRQLLQLTRCYLAFGRDLFGTSGTASQAQWDLLRELNADVPRADSNHDDHGFDANGIRHVTS